MPTSSHILALDHVQLAIPPGGEDVARSFYVDLLGLTEVPKPAPLAGRGGLWLEGGTAKIHLGIEADFRPATKAHPALIVRDLEAISARLGEHGCPTERAAPFDGRERVHTKDPFGNRIELVEGGQ